MGWQVMEGDALETLAGLDAGSVQCCVTSPPYWGLRDYGQAGQLGLEPTPGEYVARMVAVFAEVRRVLRDDGTLWLNLGDSYAGGGTIGRNDTGPEALARRAAKYGTGTGPGSAVGQQGTRPQCPGLKPKDLCGIPWRVAFALQEDGWYLRSDIIWAKPNPMPESVTDRPTKAHEYLFLLTKKARYYYDADAIREPNAAGTEQRYTAGFRDRYADGAVDAKGYRGPVGGSAGMQLNENGRNKRSVWTVATAPYSGAHFAVMPPALIEPCIKAGTKPGDLVLDPFSGAGTVGMVARRLQRLYVGIELNPEYADMSRRRIDGDAPLFNRAGQ